MAIKPKYRNKKTLIDGILFDSKREAERYCQLKILLKAGIITNLELQPAYEIRIKGKKICTYFADFRYIENGNTVIEDSKGFRTKEYILKKKMVEAEYGIKIIEV